MSQSIFPDSLDRFAVGRTHPDALTDAVNRVEGLLVAAWFSVRDGRHGGGATGTGDTDDTAAIHACRDAAGEGALVVFPAGTYLVSGLVANVADQTWVLARGATVRLAAGANTDAIRVAADGVRLYGPGKIDGNGGAQASQSDGVRLSVNTGTDPSTGDLADVTVAGLEIADCRDAGIRGFRCARVAVHDCRITDCGGYAVKFRRACADLSIRGVVARKTAPTASGTAIEVDGLSDLTGATTCYRVHVVDCHVRTWGFGGVFLNGTEDGAIVGCTADDCGDIGLDLEYSRYCTISGCTARGNANWGIACFLEAPDNTVQGCTVRENGTDPAGSSGIYLATNSHRCTVAGNVVQGNVGHGIYLAGTHDCAVGQNVVHSNTGHGIQLLLCRHAAVTGNAVRQNNESGVYLNQSDDCTVTGNACTDNGQTTASTTAGILLAGTATRNVVTGNRCGDRQVSKTQDYGLRLADAGDQENILALNHLGDNGTGALVLNSAANTRYQNRGDDATMVRRVTATRTWDPASLGAGAQLTDGVTVADAQVGDPVTAGFSQDLQGLQLTGYVSAADTVTVVLRNGTAGTVDLASGTLRVAVERY